jgi:hypothetical protein
MAKESISPKQTLIIVISALVGAVMVGTWLFLTDLGQFLMERRR